MLAVGRKRTKNLHLPAGVREIGERWHWQPTTKRERDERKAKGLSCSICLGDARTKAARERWAEVSGYRDLKIAAGTVGELLTLWERDGLKKQPNGTKRADETIDAYSRALPVLRAKFGACKYGKTAQEVARGEALGTAEIQRFVAASPKAMGNRYLAVLNNAFNHGIREGKTTYNPCRDVVKNASHAREREALEWEVEVLRCLAAPLLGLLMDLEGISAWRIGQILKLQRHLMTPAGIRGGKAKNGQRELLMWSPELRRIVAEAEALPGATRFPASPIFPAPQGGTLRYDVFDKAWQELKRCANTLLAECEVPLAIENLHFHDLRSKAHDDAVDQDRDGAEFIGDTQAVANRHYARRARRRTPLK